MAFAVVSNMEFSGIMLKNHNTGIKCHWLVLDEMSDRHFLTVSTLYCSVKHIPLVQFLGNITMLLPFPTF